jgi:hypothetical protein
MGHIALFGENRNAHEVVAKKPEGKRPFGRPEHR